MNHLAADDSHKMSSYLLKNKKKKTLRMSSAANFLQALSINISSGTDNKNCLLHTPLSGFMNTLLSEALI